MTPAKRIADAIARTGTYHKRTAVLAALIALGCCVVVIIFDRPLQKGVALVFGAIFGFGAFRSLRKSNLYFDLQGSPVLEAVTQSPRRIANVGPSDEDERNVLVVDDDGNSLSLRAGDADARAELLQAFREHATRAKVTGGAPPPNDEEDAGEVKRSEAPSEPGPTPPDGQQSSTERIPPP